MPSNPNTSNKNTSLRGFASMDREKQRAIASKGGQSVPPEKRSFSQDRTLAAEAGRKGGEHSHGGKKREATEEGRTEAKDTKAGAAAPAAHGASSAGRGAQQTSGR